MPTILPVAMPIGTNGDDTNGDDTNGDDTNGDDTNGDNTSSGPLQDRGTFTILPQGGRSPVAPGDYITVANHDPRVPASARFRGRVTEVSGPTCAFVLEASRVDPDWPQQIHPMGQGNAVYLALPCSFLPHPSRSVQTQAEWDMLLQLAADHQERTGIPPSGAIIALAALRPRAQAPP